LGEYFEENVDIHPLLPFEGDMLFQSRFGSSIRFGGYNDGEVGPWEGEHPQILIRNRENPEFKSKEFLQPVEEDINKDGSSIHITSGEIKSLFINELDMKIRFNTFPSELKEDQVILNSGRLIFSARQYEIFGFAKKTIGWITDGIYTVDAKKHIYFNTEQDAVVWAVNTRINSDKVYVGEEFNEEEPLILGTQMKNWLTKLCNALIAETHMTATGPSSPPINVAQYQNLLNTIPPLLSKRCFTV